MGQRAGMALLLAIALPPPLMAGPHQGGPAALSAATAVW